MLSIFVVQLDLFEENARIINATAKEVFVMINVDNL